MYWYIPGCCSNVNGRIGWKSVGEWSISHVLRVEICPLPTQRIFQETAWGLVFPYDKNTAVQQRLEQRFVFRTLEQTPNLPTSNPSICMKFAPFTSKSRVNVERHRYVRYLEASLSKY